MEILCLVAHGNVARIQMPVENKDM